MVDFVGHRYDVLLATTIIENGLDIPNANTIVINRADRFGLAQLHQLRGRVGRSHHRAYAYLLVPDKRSMTPDAEKRLEAIASMDELGAGFTLATHDLEIRGAGELLGENQSTYIPLGVKHRLENPGVVPLELVEVQSGTYLGEDDIVRFEDVYARA